MNKGIKDHIKHSIAAGVRGDGRGPMDFRRIEIVKGISNTAEGSARVRFGDTEVVVGVKLSIEKPFSDRPDEGIIMVGAELLPLSSPEFEAGPPDIWSIEIARVTDRGIRESKAIDANALCIKEGEKVWGVSADICSLNDDGNLLDAASLATLVALQDAKFPTVENDVVDYKHKTNKTLPLRKLPIAITVAKIGNHLIVDPSLEEQKILDARLTITTTEEGHICALQKGGDEPLTAEEVVKMVEIALDKAKELREIVKNA